MFVVKIGILASSYPRFKNDNAGIFVYNLVKNIVLDKHINQYIIAPHSKKSKFYEQQYNCKIFRFPYFFPLSLQKLCYGSGIIKNIKANKFLLLLAPWFLFSEFFFSLFLCKKKAFDLIHAHWIIPQGVIAYLLKKILKIPYIVSIHGSDIFSFNNALFKFICKIVLSNAAVVTANSTKTALAAKNIINKDVVIIPMGVDCSLFNDKFKHLHTQSEKNKAPEILFAGRLIDLKGVSFLLDAISILRLEYPEILLRIVGKGPEQKSLMQKVRQLKIDNNVVFSGTVVNHKLPDIYRKADVFVIPSIINENGETEGLGTVTLEAMACGVPVIGTNVGGIPDIIRNRVTGLLVEEKNGQMIADSIVEIMTNKHLRDEMCKNAHLLVDEKFSWDIISKQFIKLYRKSVNNRSF